MDPWEVNPLHQTFPLKKHHRDLESGLVTFHVTDRPRLNLAKKVDKVGRDQGIDALENGVLEVCEEERPGRSTESAKLQSSRRATRFSSVVRASRRYVMRGTLSVIPSVSSVRRSSFAAWNTWGSSWHGT